MIIKCNKCGKLVYTDSSEEAAMYKFFKEDAKDTGIHVGIAYCENCIKNQKIDQSNLEDFIFQKLEATRLFAKNKEEIKNPMIFIHQFISRMDYIARRIPCKSYYPDEHYLNTQLVSRIGTAIAKCCNKGVGITKEDIPKIAEITLKMQKKAMGIMR